MSAVELHLERAAFANTLGAMRDWLDHNGAGAVKFETASETGGTILVRVEFGNAELATDFANAFAGQLAPIAGPPPVLSPGTASEPVGAVKAA